MITQDALIAYLKYNPETGIFTYRKDGKNQFVKKDKTAGHKRKAGYSVIKINGKHYMQHKLAWLYIHGELPTMIDHINRNKFDNRIENLRLTTQMLNSRNRKISSLNKSGKMGVYWREEVSVFEVRIGSGYGKSIFLGRFKTYDEAVAARLGAEAVLEYDKNHGVKIGNE